MTTSIRRSVICTLSTTLALHAPAFANGFEGDWKILGEKPGTVDATVTLSRAGDEFRGTLKTFNVDPGENPDPRCERCPEPHKGKPLRGLQIIWGLKADGSKLTEGYLLDPVEGKLYRCQLELAEGGRTLRVRMYAGLPVLGVTENWSR